MSTDPEISCSSRSRTAKAREWLDETSHIHILATRVATRYGLPPADVPDLAQEVLIALWSTDPNLVISVAWLYRTATFKAIDMLRRQHSLQARNARMIQSRRLPDLTDRDLPEVVHLLRARVDRLPDQMRRFWRLRYEAGFTQEEVATRLGVSRATARRIDGRCREHLGVRYPGFFT